MADNTDQAMINNLLAKGRKYGAGHYNPYRYGKYDNYGKERADHQQFKNKIKPK